MVVGFGSQAMFPSFITFLPIIVGMGCGLLNLPDVEVDVAEVACDS